MSSFLPLLSLADNLAGSPNTGKNLQSEPHINSPANRSHTSLLREPQEPSPTHDAQDSRQPNRKSQSRLLFR